MQVSFTLTGLVILMIAFHISGDISNQDSRHPQQTLETRTDINVGKVELNQVSSSIPQNWEVDHQKGFTNENVCCVDGWGFCFHEAWQSCRQLRSLGYVFRAGVWSSDEPHGIFATYAWAWDLTLFLKITHSTSQTTCKGVQVERTPRQVDGCWDSCRPPRGTPPTSLSLSLSLSIYDMLPELMIDPPKKKYLCLYSKNSVRLQKTKWVSESYNDWRCMIQLLKKRKNPPPPEIYVIVNLNSFSCLLSIWIVFFLIRNWPKRKDGAWFEPTSNRSRSTLQRDFRSGEVEE